jgi:hypothetical protein
MDGSESGQRTVALSASPAHQVCHGEKQCCGSGMFIPDPDFHPSRIPDPKTETKERDEKKFVLYVPFHVATNFTKLKIILVLKC